jgi:hypothetical protein
MKKQIEHRVSSIEYRETGSAIIMAVVLTSLLAIVGVIFLLSSRVDSIATSAIADNKDLNLAVDSVIARISEVLAADVPGIDPNEYYDYPDANNAWLACLEPYGSAANPRWRHITDIYERFGSNADIAAQIIHDYQDPAQVRDSNFTNGIFSADADGDGVGDSMWVQVLGKASSKGKPVYAAIRIVDNGAMLNVNTGYKFDPNTYDIRQINGSSQMQINLLALASRINDVLTPAQIQTRADNLLQARANYPVSGLDPNNFALYGQDVIWRYGNPANTYAPFDISDELELRYRFLLNHEGVDTRLEDWGVEWRDSTISTPVPSGGVELDKWYRRAGSYGDSSPDPNYVYDYYAYRHIATTQNLDRIIRPDGEKMFNINYAPDFNTTNVYSAVREALDINITNDVASQITANLIDYVDDDDNVTVVYDSGGLPHFGFEQPCVYISELAQNFIRPDPNDPNILTSYAIELHKPYAEDLPPGPNEWRLVITDPNGSVVAFPFSWYGYGTGQFFVFENDAFNFIDVNLADFIANNPSPLNGAIGVDSNVILSWPDVNGAISYDIYFGLNQSEVSSATTSDINVFRGNVSASITTYDPPGALDINMTYYWRIDTHTVSSIIAGRLWQFRVSDVNSFPAAGIVFSGYDIIRLERRVFDPVSGEDIYITVDSVVVPDVDANEPNWLVPVTRDPNDPNVKFETHSYQRDIFPNKPIRRLWGFSPIPTVGNFNNYVDWDSKVIQAHPANSDFNNVGELGQLFYASTCEYIYGGVILSSLPPFRVTEPQMRINLALPVYQRLFNYLTVIDPFDHIPNANETRIKGRININTAPWFVLAQLPWVSEKINTLNYALARNIVAYRDKTSGPAGDYFTVRPGQRGFQNIGQLNLVVDPNVPLASIDYYWRDLSDLQFYPDLTTPDSSLGGAIDDFEERDVIFDRISNLVTVRSDVFTAYILVRIGPDGPQKRFVAILDRSGVKKNPNYNPPIDPFPYIGKIKVIAIQSVPDPR